MSKENLDKQLNILKSEQYGFKDPCTKEAARDVWYGRDSLENAIWVNDVPVMADGNGTEQQVLYNDAIVLPTGRDIGPVVVYKAVDDDTLVEIVGKSRESAIRMNGIERTNEDLQDLVGRLKNKGHIEVAQRIEDLYLNGAKST